MPRTLIVLISILCALLIFGVLVTLSFGSESLTAGVWTGLFFLITLSSLMLYLFRNSRFINVPFNSVYVRGELNVFGNIEKEPVVKRIFRHGETFYYQPGPFNISLLRFNSDFQLTVSENGEFDPSSQAQSHLILTKDRKWFGIEVDFYASLVKDDDENILRWSRLTMDQQILSTRTVNEWYHEMLISSLRLKASEVTYYELKDDLGGFAQVLKEHMGPKLTEDGWALNTVTVHPPVLKGEWAPQTVSA